MLVSFVDHPASLKSVKQKVKLVEQTMTTVLFVHVFVSYIDGAFEEKDLGPDVK